MSFQVRAVRASAQALVAVLFTALFFFGLHAPAVQAVGDVDLTVTVTTKAGTALTGLEVVAYEVQNHHSDFSQFVEGVAMSGQPAGRYLLDGLELNQDYALYFYVNNNPSSFDQFYGGTTWVEEAKLLRWTTAGAETLSASLATNTTITGKVSISSTTVLSGVRVTAYRFDGTGWYSVADALTSSTGVYTLRNLEPGSYRLGFKPNNIKGYAPRYSGGATTLQNATPLYAGLGSTTTSNMTLITGARISGTVGLSPFEYNSVGIVPVAYRLLGDAISGYQGIDKGEYYMGPPVASGCTGMVVYCKWTVPGLPSGGYVVKLYDFSGLLPYYEPMWVDSSDGTDKAALARIFTITAPASVTATPSTVLFTEGDIDVTSLDVTVENPSGDPVENALVSLESADNNDTQLLVATDATGIARFDRIGEGVFVAEITTDDAATHYQPDFNTFTINGTGDHAQTFTLASLTNFSFTAPATVSWGNTAVGSQFTAVVPPTTMDNGSGAEQDVDYDYQWYRGATAIFGANDDTYVTKSGDVGSTVSVVVRAQTFGFADISEVAQAGAPTALGAAAVISGSPVITSPSAAKPGVVLSANPGTWNVSGLRFSYQWKRDGAPITLSGTSRTYTLTPSDANHNVSVVVTAKKPGLQDSVPATSSPVSVGQLAAPVSTEKSVITSSTTGLPVGDVRYTISMGKWSVPGASWHVDWYTDGVQVTTTPPVSGTNSQTFVFDQATYAGKLLQAVVVVDKLGYATGTRSYLVRKGAAPSVIDPGGVTDPWHSTPLTENESVDWGTLLTATPPVLNYPNLAGNTITRAYQWQRLIGSTWTSITGATKTTYKPTTADVGKKMRLRVITSSSQYGSNTSYLHAGVAVLKWDIVGAAQPDVVIVGSTDAGATKKVQVVGAWGAPSVTLSYRWLTCDVAASPPGACDTVTNFLPWKAVTGATAASWTPPAVLQGQRIAVEVKASKSGYASLAVKSDGMNLTALDEVSYLSAPTISAGLVSGNAGVGRTLTAVAGSVDLTGAARVYTWQFSVNSGGSWSAIPGAPNALSYAPSASFLASNPGAWIRFTETASKAGLPGTDFAATPGYPLLPGALVASVAPTVSGNATSGYVVNPGTWPAGTSVSVQWRQNGSLTSTTTGPHGFVPTIANSVVTATVLATKPGYTAAPIRLVARKGTAVFTPTTLNGATVGDTFSASGTGFTFPMAAPEATYAYQWYSNNVLILNAKSPTFAASSAYLGKSLSLRLTMTSPLYNTLVGAFPAKVVAAHPAATGSPSLTGTSSAKPGVKLTVVPGTYSTTGLAFTYAIQRSTNGGGSWTTVTTASSYTLTTSDAGTLFRAVVTAKKSGWVTSVLNTGNVTVGWLGPLANVGPLTINGTGAVGSALSVAPVWNTTSVTVTYKWLRNGVIIPGVTGTTFTPLATSLGDEIDVIVNASKAGYQSIVVTSNTVKVGETLASAPVASVLPVISGATGGTNLPKVGNVLAATTGAWSVDGLTFTYQWRAAGVNIAGADESKYTVTGAEVGKVITVVVTATKTGWANGTATSKPTLATIP